MGYRQKRVDIIVQAELWYNGGMKQLLNGVKNHWLITSLNSLIIVIFAILSWNALGTDYFLTTISVGIAALAALNAAIASVIASNSSALAQKSLAMTRATQRPFLNIQVNLVKGMSLDRAIFELAVQNTGNFPADCVIVECIWFIHKDDHIEDCSLELEKVNPAIVFPSGETRTTYLVKGSENVDKLTVPGSRVKVTANYHNKLTEQRHTTRRTFRIAFASATSSINTAQAIVIPEEDYWD